MFGLDYVIVRPHNVYGERQNIGDEYRNVAGIFMNQILQGKPMSLFGDGMQIRAFGHIGEVAPVIADAIAVEAADSQVFDIGADQAYSVNELATEVARAMGAEPVIQHLPGRSEVQNAYSSHEEVQRVFGERNRVPLGDGLARMAAWVKPHGARSSREVGHIEVTRNFPKAWRPAAAPVSGARDLAAKDRTPA